MKYKSINQLYSKCYFYYFLFTQLYLIRFNLRDTENIHIEVFLYY